MALTQTFVPFFKGGGTSRPSANFDDSVPAGVDPDAKWRKESSQQFRRHGSTAAQRAGVDPGYTAGYGRSSAGNRGYGLTDKPQWDSLFTPHLGEQMRVAREGENATPPRDAGTAGIPDVAPPATVAPVAPPMPAAPPVPAMPSTPSPGNAGPQIQQINGTQSAVRQVVGLPSGQRATASIVPGQNSPASLAKRTRPAVDPYS